jgi:hypothetical protein
MTKKGKANGSFFGNFLYEQILSQRPHFLKDQAQVVDFRFVAEHCKDFYVDWGREPWDPVNLGRAQEELAALQSELAASRVQEAVAEALKAGKIQARQKESALKYAQSDLEGFRTFVEKSWPVVSLEKLSLLADDHPREAQPTSPVLAVCEALGITPEAFKAQEKQLRRSGCCKNSCQLSAPCALYILAP